MLSVTLMRIVALLLAAVAPLSAVEIQVRYAALERILASQVFTQDGRRYVKGDQKTKCSFAYLEHPQIQGKDGLLRIRARFTGRSALNMFGQCVGLGDAFTVVIGARPTYKDGNIGLASVTAEGDGKTGFYIRRVCAAIAASLARDFRYNLAADARRMMEDPNTQPAYPRDLRDFKVTAISASGDALVLDVDFTLTVK
jgi:hypothetical protein